MQRTLREDKSLDETSIEDLIKQRIRLLQKNLLPGETIDQARKVHGDIARQLLERLLRHNFRRDHVHGMATAERDALMSDPADEDKLSERFVKIVEKLSFYSETFDFDSEYNNRWTSFDVGVKASFFNDTALSRFVYAFNSVNSAPITEDRVREELRNVLGVDGSIGRLAKSNGYVNIIEGLRKTLEKLMWDARPDTQSEEEVRTDRGNREQTEETVSADKAEHGQTKSAEHGQTEGGRCVVS